MVVKELKQVLRQTLSEIINVRNNLLRKVCMRRHLIFHNAVRHHTQLPLLLKTVFAFLVPDLLLNVGLMFGRWPLLDNLLIVLLLLTEQETG